MPAKVILESAGSHVFDLGHLRREGAEELLSLVLTKAGFPQDLVWRLQVQKKIFCNSETPPVRVVDEPKKWAVYLKIKPGDNNTAHYCSLLMPDGMQAETVYRALRKVEGTLDRNWRHTTRAEANGVRPPAPPAPPPPPPAAPPVVAAPPPARDILPLTAAEPAAELLSPPNTEEPPAMTPPDQAPRMRSPLKGALQDPDKTKLILLTIEEVHAMGSLVRDNDHFVEVFCQKLGLQDINRHETGGVFAGLTRRGYIERFARGSKPVGYILSAEGQELIKDEKRGGGATALGAPPAPTDLAQTIVEFGPLAQRFVEATAQLERINAREIELCRELHELRETKREVCRFLEDEQTLQVLSRLANLRRP